MYVMNVGVQRIIKQGTLCPYYAHGGIWYLWGCRTEQTGWGYGGCDWPWHDLDQGRWPVDRRLHECQCRCHLAYFTHTTGYGRHYRACLVCGDVRYQRLWAMSSVLCESDVHRRREAPIYSYAAKNWNRNCHTFGWMSSRPTWARNRAMQICEDLRFIYPGHAHWNGITALV